jgi:hypothetical protein
MIRLKISTDIDASIEIKLYYKLARIDYFSSQYGRGK